MDTFSALAVPARRQIIELLGQRGRLSSTKISTQFKISPSAISQHLKVLYEAKLVKVERNAQQRIYEINPEAMDELSKWIHRINQRFDRLEKVLANEKLKALKN